MRILCSFVGGAGHLVPQLPLHRALADAGHRLTLVGRSSAVRGAPDIYRSTVTTPDARATISSSISPLVAVDVEHEVDVVERYFAGDAARASASRVAPLVAGADLVVCDELDFGAMAVAQRARIPVVVVSVIASGALVRPERLTAAFETLGAHLGPPVPIRPRGDFFVIPFAPAMRDPAWPAPTGSLWMRPDPARLAARDGSVVATLGTEFNTESGDLFDRLLKALAEGDAPATVAIGRDLDPARFGRQPEHVRVERFVDLETLIPRADVVLHHGGSGLFTRSILGGTPQVVFPMGADQPFTAARIRSLGIGEALDPITATPERIGQAIQRRLGTELERNATAALRESLLGLPAPAAVVHAIEDSLGPDPAGRSTARS